MTNYVYLHEALWVEEFAVGVDDLGPGLEAVVAPRAGHAIHLDLTAIKVKKLSLGKKVQYDSNNRNKTLVCTVVH